MSENGTGLIQPGIDGRGLGLGLETILGVTPPLVPKNARDPCQEHARE